MEFPKFIQDMHALDLPFPAEMVKTHCIRSDKGLMVIFDVLQEISLPPHSHLGQWGTVIEGSIKLTIDGETKTYKPGESYNIPSGVVHSATIYAGSKVMDIFEEPDRYPLKG